MYEQFFGLRERPFDLTPSPRFLVLTESHREVLSNLEYGIASRKGITLLVGEAGSGKTTLIHKAIEQQPTRVHCVHLHNPTLTREEFVEMLAVRFELSPHARASKTAMLLELEELLRTRDTQGETTVLIIDEAQSLPMDLLEEVRLLANIETSERKLLSVIVAGQPELAARLNDPALRQFKQRIALRCELRPLNVHETATYVAGRISAAGGVGGRVFTHEAVMLMHERSGGIPRLISVIADNAMLGGLAAGVQPVGTKIIREVCGDFDYRPGKAPAAAERDARLVEPAAAIEPPAAPASRVEAPPRPIPAPAPAPAPPPPAKPREAGEAAHDRPMFGSGAPKRKRFSFFGG